VVILGVVLLDAENVFCFNEVRSVAFPIKTPHNKPTARASAVLAGDQSKRERVLMIDFECADFNETIDAGYSKRCVLDIFELRKNVMVESKSGKVIDAVRIKRFELVFHRFVVLLL
jgi:hypothetical protein